MGVRAERSAVTTVLAAVRTVHESAAVCDALADRDDVERAVAIGVAPPDDDAVRRDAGDALNVLVVRLPGVDVETDQREGALTDAVAAAAADHDADEVVVAEGTAGCEELVATCDRPVVVVPDAAAGG